MDSALEASYRDSNPTTASLVRFDMPGAPLCLTDGGFVRHDAGEGNGLELYVARHPVFGSLGKLPSIKDGAESETTRLEFLLLPPSDIATAALTSPALQGIRVQWWEGTINPATGLLIGAPLLKFDGEFDKPRFRVGKSSSLTMECGTQAERQVEINVDWRLNNVFHTSIWPGEQGLIYVDGIRRKMEWRSRPESPGLFKRLLNLLVPISREKLL